MVYTSILPTKKLEKRKESESRCVDDDTGQTPSSSACNRNCQDPAKENPSKRSPVNRFYTSRNDTDTSCRACNTHSGADRDAILRSQQDSDGRSQLHGETSRRRVHGQSVTEHGHDIIAISSKTKDEYQASSNKNPNWCFSLRRRDCTCGPHIVNGCERSNTVVSSAICEIS